MTFLIEINPSPVYGPLFRDVRDGAVYRRIIGGMGWPGASRPGALAVVALEHVEGASWAGGTVRVLAEAEEGDPERLFLRAIELRKLWRAFDWLADTGDRTMVRVLARWNRELEERGLSPQSQLHPSAAPYIGEKHGFELYLRTIRRLLKANRLRFPAESVLPVRLQEVPALAGMKETPGDYPMVAALGYALAALDLWESPGSGAEAKGVAEMDYGLFGR